MLRRAQTDDLRVQNPADFADAFGDLRVHLRERDSGTCRQRGWAIALAEHEDSRVKIIATAGDLSSEDAERLRSFERERHSRLAATYHDFFMPVTSLAIKPLFEAVRLRPDADL